MDALSGETDMSQSQHTPDSLSEAARDVFPEDYLRRHRGCWVAFSPDGRRLIASSISLATLDAYIREAGEDPEEVLLERVARHAFPSAVGGAARHPSWRREAGDTMARTTVLGRVSHRRA